MSSVTMRMVAEVAGVHQATVSLALRGHPKIPVATAERIRQIAETMGYRPNPLVAALAAGRRRRTTGVQATLGYVSMDPPPGRRALLPLIDGFRRRAEELGYGVDRLCLGDPALTQARFDQIATARNIHGLLIGSLPERQQTLKLSWERFASVAYGYSVIEPDIHRVTPDIYQAMIDIFRRCREGRWRRVGLILSEQTDGKSNRLWLAAYLAEQCDAPAFEPLPPLRLAKWDAEKVTAWFRRYRPEVILGLHSMLVQVERWMQSRAGEVFRPQRIALNASSARPSHRFSGVMLNREVSGATCADLLVGMLHRNERGIPASNLHIFTKTGWWEGESFRPRP